MNSNDAIYMYINNNMLDIDKIVDDYSAYLYTIIKNAGSFDKEDIEEIISDTYLILWNNQNKLDLDKKLSSYLVGIVKNLIKKRYKLFYNVKENIEDYNEKLIENSNFDVVLLNKELSNKVIEILDLFNSEDREIFEAFYYNMRKIKEIAITYNISESKVKTKLHRIRNKIRKELLKGGYSLNG